MYLSTIDRPRGGDHARRGMRGTVAAVGTNVLALGTVSLLTDISAEMVTAVLPLYFALALHMGPAAYGLMDGLYTGATALLRLVGGYAADRTRRRKAVAGAGYGISALAKLGLVAAGSSVPALGAVIVADRAGKGLRTAPRDALITLSVPEPLLGRAFGIHRTMDSMGAFAGPLAALGLLAVVGATSPAAFHALFLTSFCIAAAGLLALAGLARDPRDERSVAPAAVSFRRAGALLRSPALRRLLCAAGLLGLATVGDGFVYLLLMRRQSMPAGWFPLMAVGTNLVYLLLAAPLGSLADRLGRRTVLLAGYGALLAVYLLLSSPLSGARLTVAALCCYGTFYAATDGVLMALAGPLLPTALRTTGLACVQTVQALAYFGSSVAFGLAWSGWGSTAATAAAAGATLLAVTATAVLLRDHTDEGAEA
ncbi:MFS transporter [Streptomyces qinglanensis]|uniref:Major Facilitator Superfamily protein n=1 Tax=Streptomyces qinglanensis TaxID=943816 RepID=A0A1H9S5F2_9ACTN|nr:MFS transporter [Streptomyces qinglanensis]SER80217.1 Major Facilitator Superfamily protein [Streptomyces qinglanensis]